MTSQPRDWVQGLHQPSLLKKADLGAHLFPNRDGTTGSTAESWRGLAEAYHTLQPINTGAYSGQLTLKVHAEAQYTQGSSHTMKCFDLS